MNDKEFRENCKIFAKDVIDFYSDWRKSLREPQSWLDKMEDTNQLATAALLYIASNTTVSNQEKNNCAFCGKNKQKIIDNGGIGVFLDVKNKMITLEEQTYYSNTSEPTNSLVGSFPIAYCPVCRRKLWKKSLYGVKLVEEK